MRTSRHLSLVLLVCTFCFRCGNQSSAGSGNSSPPSPDAGTDAGAAGNPDAGNGNGGPADAGTGPADAGTLADALSLMVTRSGPGTVRSSPAGIDCGGACIASFTQGTSVALSASPDGSATFSGWGGACAGTSGCTIVLSADADVSAAFTGAVVSDECSAIRPPPVGPPGGRHTMQAGGDCQAGVSDGNGTLALGVDNVIPVSNSMLHFVSPAGDLLAAYPGTNASLTGQLSGFEGQVFTGIGQERYLLRTWDASGHAIAETPPFPDGPQMITENPLGGIVIWRFSATPAVIESYDEHLNLRWRVNQPGVDPGAFAVDRAGRTLILFGGSLREKLLDGMWIDEHGTAGPVFHLGPQDAFAHQLGLQLTQRVQDGLFLQTGGKWTGQFDSLARAASSPPAWLESRPDTRLHMVHGGTGYAVLSSAGGAGRCAQAVEVVAPSGTSCGTVAFPSASDSCSFATGSVGYDGTAMVASSKVTDGCANSGTCTCTWQWWPGFFR